MTNSTTPLPRECRFAIHIPTKHVQDLPDLHLVKEQCHQIDGSIIPNLRWVKNYGRDFFITNKNERNFLQKKEWMEIDKLTKVTCTQSQLRDKVARSLDKSWSKDSLKQLSNSPYLYGSDISSTSLIKNEYRNRFPGVETPYTLSTLDVETDVLFGTNEVTICTITFKTKNKLHVLTVAQKSFIEGFANVEKQVYEKLDFYLADYVKKLNIDFVFKIAETEIDLIKIIFDQLHQWKPDFVAIWNIDFDIQRIMEACERGNTDPKDIFSDPIIPKDLRFFKYNQGIKKKVTASGKETPINPADQWHSVSCPSSFWFIDAMCVYRQIRLAEQAENSYSLDSILEKQLGIRKLKFEAADEYIGIKWHQFMASQYKIEYIIYNAFDSISMIELDNKTLDLQITLPMYAQTTDFSRFNSQPKKIADAMHYFLLENSRVAGTVGQVAKEEEEDVAEIEDENGDLIRNPTKSDSLDTAKVLSLRDWIITLPAHLTTEAGMNCILENDQIHTNARAYVFDSDAVSSYPSDILALNVSKETTVKEFIDVPSVPEDVFRLQGINLLSGHTNAMEYCQTMLRFPEPEALLKLYNNTKF